MIDGSNRKIPEIDLGRRFFCRIPSDLETEMNNYSRRQFVKAGSAISAGTLSLQPHIANAQNSSKTLKVGLVGIGGRGSGAAAQAMAADDNVFSSSVILFLRTVSNWCSRIRVSGA